MSSEIVKEQLVRHFVFKKKFDPNLISVNNMGLYKNVFKLDEDFLRLVGPEKMDFDRRFMLKPPNLVKKASSKIPINHITQFGKKNDEIIDENKRYIRTMFNDFQNGSLFEQVQN